MADVGSLAGWLCVAHYNYRHPRGVSGQGGISDNIREGTSLKRLMAPHLLSYSRGHTILAAPHKRCLQLRW